LYRDAKGKIAAITFDPSFEHQLTSSLRQEGGELTLGVAAEMAIDLNRKTADAGNPSWIQGRDKAILLCDARLRAPWLRCWRGVCRCCRLWPTTRSFWDDVQSIGHDFSHTQ